MANDNEVPKFPAKPYNRIVPRSQGSSGAKLDEVCYPNAGGEIPQAAAGLGLDEAVRTLDKK